MNTIEHKFIETNGIKMHYVTAGKGPLLILLHGFPQFWYSWRRQIPILAEKFQVVAPDLRGYNETERPHNVADYNMKELIKDILGLIHGLGHDKAFVVGHDWGGSIAWRLTMEHPEAVEKLVILNSPHPVKFAKAISSDFNQMKKSWYIFLFLIPYLPEFLLTRNVKKTVKGMYNKSAVNKDAFTDEDITEYTNALSKPGAVTAALNYYRAAFKYKTDLRKIKIQTPTLIIWGEEDRALGKELTHQMDSLFSGPFKIQYVPGSGHWVQEEKPELVTRSIEEFLLEKKG